MCEYQLILTTFKVVDLICFQRWGGACSSSLSRQINYFFIPGSLWIFSFVWQSIACLSICLAVKWTIDFTSFSQAHTQAHTHAHTHTHTFLGSLKHSRIHTYVSTNPSTQAGCGNLLSFLLRCGTRPYEWGTQWDSNSLV